MTLLCNAILDVCTVYFIAWWTVQDGRRERETGGVIGDNVVGQFNPIADLHKQCTITTWVSVVGFA